MMMAASEDEAAGTDQSDPTRTDPSESAAAPDVNADVHTYIGARLRKAFDDVAKQPVPERFLQLMRDLDRG